MTLLLQISDPHFGTEQPGVLQALRQLVREQAPNVLVLSGDITQRAHAYQFDAARLFVKELAIPASLALPGNHDIPLFNPFARLFRPYGNYCDAFGPELNPSLETLDMLVLGVNTTRWWRHKNGEVSRAQVMQVSKRLAAAKSRQLRVVVVHQPVHVLRPSDEHDRLRGYEAAVRAWSAAGADIVMGGHIHLPYVRALHEELPRLPRRIWCVQAGTAVSSRVRGTTPNSVNLLRHGPSHTPLSCQSERWDYAGATGRFRLVESHELVLDRDTQSLF